MSGEVKSPKEQLDYLNEMLDAYESKIGLSKGVEHSGVQHILDKMSDVSVLTANECGEMAVVLSAYSMHLQRIYNKEVSVHNWADSKLGQYVDAHSDQYGGNYRHIDERRALVIRNDSYASKLVKIRDWAKQRMNRLYGLSGKFEHLSKTLLELQNSRRRSNA